MRSVMRPVAGAVRAPTAVLSEPMSPSSKRLRSNSSMSTLASTETTKIWNAVDTIVVTRTTLRAGVSARLEGDNGTVKSRTGTVERHRIRVG